MRGTGAAVGGGLIVVGGKAVDSLWQGSVDAAIEFGLKACAEQKKKSSESWGCCEISYTVRNINPMDPLRSRSDVEALLGKPDIVLPMEKDIRLYYEWKIPPSVRIALPAGQAQEYLSGVSFRIVSASQRVVKWDWSFTVVRALDEVPAKTGEPS